MGTDSQTTHPQVIENLRAQSHDLQEVIDRLEAEVARRVVTAIGHLDAMNFGLAKEELSNLAMDLAHDAGPMRYTPMRDRHAQAVAERRSRRN